MDSPDPRAEGARGPEQVRESLILAALELLETSSPNLISSRQIARRAGVNYGLIHQYFGGRPGLILAVLERAATRITGDLGMQDIATWWQTQVDHDNPGDGLWRAVANLMSDVEVLQEANWTVPFMKQMQQTLAAEHPDRAVTAVKAEVASIVVTLLGWSLMEPAFRLYLADGDDELAAMKSGVFGAVAERLEDDG